MLDDLCRTMDGYVCSTVIDGSIVGVFLYIAFLLVAMVGAGGTLVPIIGTRRAEAIGSQMREWSGAILSWDTKICGSSARISVAAGNRYARVGAVRPQR